MKDRLCIIGFVTFKPKQDNSESSKSCNTLCSLKTYSTENQINCFSVLLCLLCYSVCFINAFVFLVFVYTNVTYYGVFFQKVFFTILMYCYEANINISINVEKFTTSL